LLRPDAAPVPKVVRSIVRARQLVRFLPSA
jgi:hypothetical protein